jgi:hypothetical protein
VKGKLQNTTAKNFKIQNPNFKENSKSKLQSETYLGAWDLKCEIPR